MKENFDFILFSRLSCLVVAVFLVAGCADVRGPSWLTGEPDPAELVHSRPLSGPKLPRNEGWPRLADVPEEKPVFSSEAERALATESLLSERMKADAEMERLQNIDLYGEEPPPEMQEDPFSFSSLKP